LITENLKSAAHVPKEHWEGDGRAEAHPRDVQDADADAGHVIESELGSI
jgi:hypothetical protein